MHTKVVVTVVKDKLVLETVEKSNDSQVVERKVVDWSRADLAKNLELLVGELTPATKLRLVVSDKLCHVVGFKVALKKADDRSFIAQLASELIPEDLEVVKWDYAVISSKEDKAMIQVFAFTERLNHEFESLSAELRDRIELILPCSLTLLESIAEKDQSFLLLYAGELDRVLVLVKTGVIQLATAFNHKNVAQKILESMNYASSYLEFVPQNIIVSGEIPAQVLKELKKNFKLVEAQISASVNAAELTKLFGPDKKVLNISLAKKRSVLAELEQHLKSTTLKSGWRWQFSLILGLIALVGIFLGFSLVTKFN